MLISTPYFTELQKLSVRTSKTRSQNNYLSNDLAYIGFSKSEINEITETEFFLFSRVCVKKRCSGCKKTISTKWFGKDKNRKHGVIDYCRACKKENDSKAYYKNHELSKEKKRRDKVNLELKQRLLNE